MFGAASKRFREAGALIKRDGPTSASAAAKLFQACDLNPLHLECILMKGRLLAEQGHKKEGIAWFQKVRLSLPYLASNGFKRHRARM